MKTITTPKGTVLPILNLKGKDYLQVAHRLVWFREVYPLGKFETECVECTDKYVVYKAHVSVPYNGGEYVKLADGVKREDFSHFSDAHEKAQTGAIGRALAMIGFGTQFAPELDEDDRIVDSPVERPRKQMARQDDVPAFDYPGNIQTPMPSDDYVIPFGKYKGKTFGDVPMKDLQDYASYIIDKANKEGKPLTGSVQDFVDRVAVL
jgi:hypothetical protein